MYLSIRDEIVFAAGYAALSEGLRDLKIPGVELFVLRDDTVAAIAPAEGRARLNLCDPADRAELTRQAEANGVVISALCMGNNFNADDKAAEIDMGRAHSSQLPPSSERPRFASMQ